MSERRAGRLLRKVVRTILRVSVLLVAVLAGLYLVPYALVVWPVQRAEYKSMVTDRMPLIEATLRAMLVDAGPACVLGERYLVPTGAHVTGPFAGVDADYLPRTCHRCGDLVAAGLLAPTTDVGTGAQPASRFDLTPLGRETYDEDFEPSQNAAWQYVRWKFCFGEARLYRVDEALPPMSSSVGVKYTAEIVDPHPFLFDPRSRPLGIEAPAKGRPALLEPKITTITFREDGTAEADDNFRYGKLANDD